jgi:hypothetical protein
MFQSYVASVSYGHCKSRSRYCRCCNDCICMLQFFVVNVSSFFRCMLQVCLSRCCICFHPYITKCFIWMLRMFCNVFKCFLTVFASVSDACFKCFIVFTYAAIVASGCFQTRSGVASPSSPSVVSPCCQTRKVRAGGGGPCLCGRSLRACAGAWQHTACAAAASWAHNSIRCGR